MVLQKQRVGNRETWVSINTIGLQGRSWAICQGLVISKCGVLGMDIDNSGSTCNRCQDTVLGNFEGCEINLFIRTIFEQYCLCLLEFRNSYTLQFTTCSAHSWPVLHWPLALCAHSRTVFWNPNAFYHTEVSGSPVFINSQLQEN